MSRRNRALSRRSSANVLGGTGSLFRRGQPLEPLRGRAQGRPKPRMPRRASALLIRLPMRVRSPTRFSRSRLCRFASSSSRLGIAAMLQ